MMKKTKKTNFNVTKSIPDIVRGVSESAEKSGVHLTHGNINVYLRLLEYAQHEAELAADAVSEELVVFDFTTKVLFEYCERTNNKVPVRIIDESLHKFKKCGVIKYEAAPYHGSVVSLYKNFF